MENIAPPPAKSPLTIVFPPANKNGITPAKGTRVLDQDGNEITGVTGIRLSACVNGLWKAEVELNAVTFYGAAHVDNPLSPPRIGDYWPGQGGVYAGIMRDGARSWHLILAIDPTSILHDVEWGQHGTLIPGEFSARNGEHNTKLILAAEPDNKIATHITALLIDGHKDFYLPAQCENNLLFANVPEHLSRIIHWSSTQCSAHFAWFQYFGDGYQYVDSKGSSLAARAVRRILII